MEPLVIVVGARVVRRHGLHELGMRDEEPLHVELQLVEGRLLLGLDLLPLGFLLLLFRLIGGMFQGQQKSSD